MKITSSQLRKLIKEEMADALGSKDPQRFLHGFESGHPMDDEGYMIKSRMADVKEMAETICNLLDEGDQLPAWVQDLVASAHTDLEHVKDYLTGDEKLRAHKGETDMGPPISAESRKHRGGMLLEGHNRITPEEMRAWMGGDWGYVSEVDYRRPMGGGAGGRRHKAPEPGDPAALADYIKSNSDFLGAAQDMEVDLASPEMRQYVGDNLAGQYSRSDIDAAWKLL